MRLGSPLPADEVEYLDNFVWTPQLRADYARRARELAHRYGAHEPVTGIPSRPGGRCLDCGLEVERRYLLGRVAVCRRDAELRLRVRRQLDELELAA
jgi:hypothetical protein